MRVLAPEALRETNNGGKICSVSFDFDDTMTLPEYDPSTQMWISGKEPNYIILNEIARLACEGWRIIIISERSNSEASVDLIVKFCNKYQLPIKNIIYTNGNEKLSYLKTAGVVIHYDDDPYEIECLVDSGIIGVHVPHPSDEKNRCSFPSRRD